MSKKHVSHAGRPGRGSGGWPPGKHSWLLRRTRRKQGGRP